MAGDNLYKCYGAKEEELAQWARSNLGACPVCCNLDIKSWDYGIPIRTAGLPKSRENCTFCDILFNAVQTPYFFSLTKEPNFYIRAFLSTSASQGDISYRRLIFRLDSFSYIEEETFPSVDIFLLTRHREWPFDIAKGLTPETTSSDEALASIYTWLKDCDRLHPACAGSGKFTPRRLLTVDAQKKKTSLIELDVNEPIKYACLSHCWGSHQPLMTTTATIQQRKDGINWDELPKTFREALYLCSNLGLSYIWIDSLCIIQDDAEDWAREASTMEAVYSGSYITIAASASHNSTEGCFKTTDCPAYKFQTTFTDGSEVEFFVRKHIKHTYSINETTYINTDGIWSTESSWPLMHRAWAFQERLLSPRVLHFGPSEVVWECQEHTLCACSEKDSQFDSPHLIRKSDWYNGLENLVCSEDEILFQKTACELWKKIVMEYSCRRLTFQKDVLPALSGIAKRFYNRTSIGSLKGYPGTYLAGMWGSDLLRQLMWITVYANYSPELVVTRELPVPSWSWAAYKGAGVTFCEASYHLTEFNEEAEIVSCSCELRTLYDYGEVSSGLLQLQTQVLFLRLHRASQSHDHYFTEHNEDSVVEAFNQIIIHLDFEYEFSGAYTNIESKSICTIEHAYVANMGLGESKYGRVRIALILRKLDLQERFERIGVAICLLKRNSPDDVFQRKGKSMLLDIV